MHQALVLSAKNLLALRALLTTPSASSLPIDVPGLQFALDHVCDADYFSLVEERPGSADGPTFGKHVYVDFDQACNALRARATEDFDPEMDPELSLSHCRCNDTLTYFIYLETESGACRAQYYLQKATMAPDFFIADGTSLSTNQPKLEGAAQ